MGLLLGLPLRLLALMLLLLRLVLPLLALMLVLWLVRRSIRPPVARDAPEASDAPEPRFDGPVYTVDYEEVEDEPEQ